MDLNFGSAEVADRVFGNKKPKGLMPRSPTPAILSVARNKWDSLRTANDLLDCKPREALEDVCLIMDEYRVCYGFSCRCEVQVLLSNKRVGIFWFILVTIWSIEVYDAFTVTFST